MGRLGPARRGLPLNPQKDAVISQFKKIRDGFGSLAYLTVTVTVNGVSAPDSPFFDVAINESISDIDVSGLITPGVNMIRIAIAKYGLPAGNVSARVNIALSGRVVMDTLN